MYTTIVKKLEKIFVFLVYYIVPIAVIAFLLLIVFRILPTGETQELMANWGLGLLIAVLFIKPIAILAKRYFNTSYRKLPDGISYLLKGWTKDPIGIYIKNLILNSVYSASLYGLRFRRQLGILTFWCILSHWIVLETMRYYQGAPFLITSANLFVWMGVIGLIALFVGFVTSNTFSMLKLKRRRKYVQQIAYLAFAGACIHLFFFSHSRWYIVLLVVFIVLKFLEWRKPKNTVVAAAPAKPVAPELMQAKVINHQYIVPEVLELSLEVHQELTVIPGQWALFVLKDKEGEFNRAYSIASHDVDEGSTLLTFTIKITADGGRGTKLLDQVKLGDTLQIKGIFGHFLVQKTDVPKVFIGTGTGLAPLINMASHCECKDKTLIYSVPYFKNLFYEDKIKKIHDLKYEFHITREEVPGYEFGRLDLTKKSFSPDTEFYVCGNPKVVEQIIQELKGLEYKNIFSERFG